VVWKNFGIKKVKSLDGKPERVYSAGSDMETRTHTEAEIDRLASRHIARCLDRLGVDFSPALAASIKRSFRFFADDMKQVVHVASIGTEKGGGNA